MAERKKYKLIVSLGSWSVGQYVSLTDDQADSYANKGVISLDADDSNDSTIEDLRIAYSEATGKEVSARYKNDSDWMNKKIEEAK